MFSDQAEVVLKDSHIFLQLDTKLIEILYICRDESFR